MILVLDPEEGQVWLHDTIASACTTWHEGQSLWEQSGQGRPQEVQVSRIQKIRTQLAAKAK